MADPVLDPVLDQPMAQFERTNPPPHVFWSQVTEVLLGRGQHRTRFQVHPDILRHFNDYFDFALADHGEENRQWREGAHNQVEITELLEGTDFDDDDQLFSQFLWTLYRQNLFIVDPWHESVPVESCV